MTRDISQEIERFVERFNGEDAWKITPKATELIEELWKIPGCPHEKNPTPYGLDEMLGVLDCCVVFDNGSEVETELTITYNVRTGFELACKWDVLPPKWYAIDWEETINTGKGETLEDAIIDLLEKMVAAKNDMLEWYFDDEVDDEDYYIDEKYDAYRIAQYEKENR